MKLTTLMTQQDLEMCVGVNYYDCGPETVEFRRTTSSVPKSAIMQNFTLCCEKPDYLTCVIICVKRKTTQPDIFRTENYIPVKYIYSSLSKRLNPVLKILLFVLYKSIEFLFIA